MASLLENAMELEANPVSPLTPADAGKPLQLASLALPVPANLIEFTQMYGDEDACLEALIKARWPRGFVCPRCAHTTGWRHANRRLIECASCGHQASPTAGTLFHMAKLELHKLFLMLYLIVAEKDGANAKQLQRQAGVNYKTARLWLFKIREMLRVRDKDKGEGLPEHGDAHDNGVPDRRTAGEGARSIHPATRPNQFHMKQRGTFLVLVPVVLTTQILLTRRTTPSTSHAD